MITHCNNSDIYIGRGARSRLKKEMEGAKESIKIISPYLTSSYVEDLLKLSKKGIDVTLITANEVKEGDGNYSSLKHTDLIKQKRTTDYKTKEVREKGIRNSGFGFLLPIVLLLFQFYAFAIISAVIIGLVLLHFFQKRIYSYTYYSPIKLKIIPDEYHDREKGKYFVHSKVYVIDDEIAYLGSVNYTFKAFKYNYETLTRVSSKTSVGDISKEVKRLFCDKDIYSLNIKEWGRELYDEPKN